MAKRRDDFITEKKFIFDRVKQQIQVGNVKKIGFMCSVVKMYNTVNLEECRFD